jgi:hypothetical protein
MRPHQSWNYSSRSKWCVCLGCPQRLMLAAMMCCTGMCTIDLFLLFLLLLFLLLLLSLLLLLLLLYDCFLVCKSHSLYSFYNSPYERIEHLWTDLCIPSFIFPYYSMPPYLTTIQECALCGVQDGQAPHHTRTG